ncbi:hypothetical protein SAMN05428642_101907 [Flaviramulus basaltis]|uniref:CarboxypepD_reg-like domain-containing protein n=1 Tax=Flaviramulus basaltis TaxID=369401 RepID=A0A1K2IFA3_9FLAO|nr:TonB-dependent receptor [Flaviramulus basaltis]SFZ90387.1 hypothetical protein SAMN05428642_101907 [Flaviramulus basaltis]
MLYESKSWAFKHAFFILLGLFLTSYIYSQNIIIKGKIYDEQLNPINGTLLVKKAISPKIIAEYYLIRNGEFSYRLKSIYNEDIIIEITSIGYQTHTEVVDVKNSTSIVTIDAQMFKSKITELNEVVVKAKKRPFEIKNDTVVFNVEAYKDGTERKVEDLLKKLPGIEINSKTGIIKYNGKSIETVMLEGDNLFGYNYTLGTKNINIDIIQSIEAIENYSENKLLKGIENSEKVALNLKLKSGKLDFSGSLDINGGFSSDSKLRSNSSVNLLGINKSFKSFGIISYNNVGINTSPFDYSNVMDNLEVIKEMNYRARKIIPETLLASSFDEKRTNINDQFFSNYNSIFKLGRLLKAKINLYYLDDSLNNFENSTNNYSINNIQFQTFDNKKISNKLKQYRGDLKLDYFTSKTSLLEYKLSLRDEPMNINSIIDSNIRDNINSLQESDNLFITQNLLFTKKISDKNALQINFISSLNSISQELEISPSIYNANLDQQNISLKKQFFKFNTTFLGSGNINKYKFSLGCNFTEEPLETNFISSSNNNIITNGLNYIEHQTKEVYAFAENLMKFNKFSLRPNFTLRYLSQNLIDRNTGNSEFAKDFIFEPSLRLLYGINRNSNIQTSFSLNKNTSNINRFFSNDILLSNRNIQKNEIDLRLQNNQFYDLSYSNNDLFNQLQLRIGISYLKQKGNFFANSQINDNLIVTNYFFLPEGTETLDFNLNFTKYIPFLKLNVKTNSFYSINNYKNIVNNSSLRNNKASSLTSELFLKTSLKSDLNFENETVLRTVKTVSEVQFENSYFQNKLKIIYKPTKSLLATFSFDHFIPDLSKQASNFTLLDTKFSYIPKKNWEINLIGNNLTNIKEFTIFQNNDTSTNSNSLGLLPRYFMLGFNWNF